MGLPRPLHIVLVNPAIPSNTGSIGRMCLGLGAALHLVEPMGFELTDSRVKRAGLDYWPRVDVRRHASWSRLEQHLAEQAGVGERQTFFLSKYGTRSLLQARFLDPPLLGDGSGGGGGGAGLPARPIALVRTTGAAVLNSAARHPFAMLCTAALLAD